MDYTVCAFRYEAPIDYLVSQMKFHQQLSCAAILSELLKNKIINLKNEAEWPNAIVAMPLHKKRLIQRGFNQSLEISRAIVKNKQLPILNNSVSRIKNTKSQLNLSKKERFKNVKNCFQLNKEINESHIVIVDDVVTTGASSNELAELLKHSGVKKVGVWALARADLNTVK